MGVEKYILLLTGSKIIISLHSRSMKFWSGSSAWLEYVPVTHGVAGSSPVRTANMG